MVVARNPATIRGEARRQEAPVARRRLAQTIHAAPQVNLRAMAWPVFTPPVAEKLDRDAATLTVAEIAGYLQDRLGQRDRRAR